MRIQIHVTKEIYRRSMMCGVHALPKGCAIALAVRDIAPNARVAATIWWDEQRIFRSGLPEIAENMIRKFDSLKDTPEKRLDLPEFSFEVDFPDAMVEQIGIEQVHAILEKSETLSLVS